MTFVFKHPKFYRIPRDKKDQAISCVMTERRLTSGRAPGPGHKLDVPAPAGPSVKPQAASTKPQAPSSDKKE